MEGGVEGAATGVTADSSSTAGTPAGSSQPHPQQPPPPPAGPGAQTPSRPPTAGRTGGRPTSTRGSERKKEQPLLHIFFVQPSVFVTPFGKNSHAPNLPPPAFSGKSTVHNPPSERRDKCVCACAREHSEWKKGGDRKFDGGQKDTGVGAKPVTREAFVCARLVDGKGKSKGPWKKANRLFVSFCVCEGGSKKKEIAAGKKSKKGFSFHHATTCAATAATSTTRAATITAATTCTRPRCCTAAAGAGAGVTASG